MSTHCLQPVAIFWDIENCGVPRGVNAEDVAVHIRMALKLHEALRGPIIVFSAYGDFSHLSPRIRQGCQKTGVNLIDIPHVSKDAADKAILVDMFLFALDNPPPCTVVLISGDVDFACALHKLGQRGYCVVLAIPSGLHVSRTLCNACQYLWSWPDIACGKGLTTEKNIATRAFEDYKAPVGAVLNAGNIHIDQIKGKYQEAGQRGLKDACELPRKLPAGMFEEYVEVPSCLVKELTKIPVVMGVDHNDMSAIDMNRSFFSPSCGMDCPFISHNVTGFKDATPLASQAINHGISSAYEKCGHISKGLAAHYAGTSDIGPSFNTSHVAANNPAEFARRCDKDPSSQPPSQNAQKQFANFKLGNSTYKLGTHTKGQNPFSLKKKKKKKKKGKLGTVWELEKSWKKKMVGAAPCPRQLRRSARLAARRAQGLCP